MQSDGRFGKIARMQQAVFRATLSQAAQHPSDVIGERDGHLLAQGYEIENLYPELRADGGALQFFRDRGIKWWTSPRSGDRKVGDGFEGPTRNLASSQVSCVNFLLPLVDVPEALVAFLQCIDGDITGIEPIVDQDGRRSTVEFEWVGWERPLEGGSITRGANQTSVDAFLVARIPNGLRAYLIEWKYCEAYPHPEDKGQGRSGMTRCQRYTAMFSRPQSSFNQAMPLEEFFFEPFYQIMRLLLLRDCMMLDGVTPDLPVTDAKVIVICPKANHDYRRAVPETPLCRRFPSLRQLEEVVHATLNDPSVFAVAAQEDVVAALRSRPVAECLKPWLDYHEARYGW